MNASYIIEGLGAKVIEQIFARGRENQVNACLVLEAAWERWSAGEFTVDVSGRLAQVPITAIEKSAHVALAKFGCLREGGMQKVLLIKCLDACEEDMVNTLQRWCPHSSEMNRADGAQRLIGCLSLKKMSASFLKNVVAKSDRVSKDDMCPVPAGRGWLFWHFPREMLRVTGP